VVKTGAGEFRTKIKKYQVILTAINKFFVFCHAWKLQIIVKNNIV
jgi:hypothetical protein